MKSTLDGLWSSPQPVTGTKEGVKALRLTECVSPPHFLKISPYHVDMRLGRAAFLETKPAV